MPARESRSFAEFAPEAGGVAPLRVTVRPASDADIPGILNINNQAGRPANTADSLAFAISDPGRLVVVATMAGEMSGWAKTHHWGYPDGEAPAGHYLGGVTVLPEVRRRGVAAALTDARLDWIWQRSETAWYVVNADNLASIALHRRWGFAEAARAPSFHTAQFSGGVGLLMRAVRPPTWR
ncbi:ribosomal protein S18 acetylase RimI-like enzyme [Arthrobacter silviterrae]|uniref:GNAT family N-acetyltransferase n=1 Tax=Arthrobacter silviterrae TaxID=2026658 RepID=UPI002789DB7B|nr:GNAT family N-acetyltransferase [Arthrobacter silviterrae]MDQ0276220.1 ribosomal protein S18 acetylase RimI-like enzyme [Arthrobacter silviterrae]